MTTSVKWPRRGSARRVAIGWAGSATKFSTKPTNTLRGSAGVPGGGGIGTGGGTSGGGGMRAVAKCMRSASVVWSSLTRLFSIDELPRSSAKGSR